MRSAAAHLVFCAVFWAGCTGDPCFFDAGSGEPGAADGDADGDDAGPGDDSAGCRPGTFVLEGFVPNARDLGGTPLGAGRAVACGRLYRGSRFPALFGEGEGCAAFARLGVRTVIDLRVDSERGTEPEPACVAAQARVVWAPMPVPYSVSPADYIADLDASASVAAAFAVFGDEGAYPVYQHCVYGRDRTGVLSALVLLALGASREEVLAEYRLSEQGGVGSYPESLQAVLDEIERRGGVETVLAAAGVNPAQLETLRRLAVAGSGDADGGS